MEIVIKNYFVIFKLKFKKISKSKVEDYVFIHFLKKKDGDVGRLLVCLGLNVVYTCIYSEVSLCETWLYSRVEIVLLNL